MKDPIKQMLAAMMAAELDRQITEFEANDGGATWLRAAARELHPNDLRALIAKAKELRSKFIEDADGCPSKVFQWGKFFDSKMPNDTAKGLARSDSPVERRVGRLSNESKEMK